MRKFILIALAVFSLWAFTVYAGGTCSSPAVKICGICYDCGFDEPGAGVCPTDYGVTCPTSGSRCDPDCGTCVITCSVDQHLEGTSCVSNTKACTASCTNGQGTGIQTWANGAWGACSATGCASCNANFHLEGSGCVQDNSPPTVTLSEDKQTVSGSVTFSVTASDADGDSIADIRFDLNYAGNWNNDICPGKSGASASCTWDSVAQWAATRMTPGTATLRVKATDANGAESSSVTDEFTVDNRPNAPTLTDISGYSEGGINTGSVSFQSNPAATAPAAIASVQYWIKLGSTGTWISICTAASSPWSCAWNSNTNVPTSNDQVYVKAQATESAPLGRSVEKEEGPFKVDNGCAARGDGSSCGTGAYCLSGACCGDTANERYTSITTGGICLDSTSTAPLCCGAGQVQRNGRCVEGCTETRCYDEVDNDGDGNTDCADTDCTSPIRTGATGAFCCSNTQCDNNNQCDTDTKKCISVLDPKTGNNPVCCLTYDQCIAASGTPRYPGLTPDQCVRHGVWVDGSCI